MRSQKLAKRLLHLPLPRLWLKKEFNCSVLSIIQNPSLVFLSPGSQCGIVHGIVPSLPLYVAGVLANTTTSTQLRDWPILHHPKKIAHDEAYQKNNMRGKLLVLGAVYKEGYTGMHLHTTWPYWNILGTLNSSTLTFLPFLFFWQHRGAWLLTSPAQKKQATRIWFPFFKPQKLKNGTQIWPSSEASEKGCPINADQRQLAWFQVLASFIFVLGYNMIFKQIGGRLGHTY